jgi:predicted nucleic acid-binding Zn ribbon protein
VLCKNPPTGARSNPAPIPDKVQVSNAPISTNGTTSSVDSLCNASLCPVCNAPLTPPKKFCSKKCGTLSRVRRLRAKTAPLRALKAKVENGFQSERRSAVTDCTAGTSRLRDVGKDTDYERAKEIEKVCADARKKLRAASTKQRRELKRQRKEAWQVVLALSKQIKGLTPALVLAIAESEAVIRKQTQ